MELESLKHNLMFLGWLMINMLKAKKYTNTVFSNEIYFSCFGKHLEHIKMNQIARG
jgi:hypothetical protein